MAAGPHVFGKNRLGLWVIPNSNLRDKLIHILPRVRGPLPNLTDIFLPPQASIGHKDQCRQAGFYTHLYDVVHDRSASVMASVMLKRRREVGYGGIEIDLEGTAVPDFKMKQYVIDFVGTVRKTNPNLPVRLNVPPFKGYSLPVSLINEDKELFVIAQSYFGNQDGRLSEAEVLEDLLDWGISRDKVKVMYAVLADNPQNQRVYTLPNPEYQPINHGSVFNDDLLIDAGLLP